MTALSFNFLDPKSIAAAQRVVRFMVVLHAVFFTLLLAAIAGVGTWAVTWLEMNR